MPRRGAPLRTITLVLLTCACATPLHPARAAEQRRATHDADPVREQRARERVAGEAVVPVPVEGEAERPGPIEEPPSRLEAPHGGSLSPIRKLPRISCVTVDRSALNHRRHPAVCIQRSANIPRGLSRMKR